MDILDVGLTIEEFRKEWNLKYSPNDIKFWAPLLDSDLPIQKSCARMLFEAWGKPKVVEHYQKWMSLQDRKEELKESYEEASKRWWDDYNPDNYDDDFYFYGETKYISRKVQHTARFRKYFDDSDYLASQMTWPEYFESRVFGKGVEL